MYYNETYGGNKWNIIKKLIQDIELKAVKKKDIIIQ
jgi:hypothetical protein